MDDYIMIKIKRPNDGSYDDVCPELIVEDFIANPRAWEIELVPNATAKEKA